MNKELIAVWGVGHIGMTTLISLANSGYKGIAIDVNNKVVNRLNSGNDLLAMLDEYYCEANELGIKNIEIVAYNLDDIQNLENAIGIHFVCVPTELNGFPMMDTVKDTILKICDFEKEKENQNVTVVVESTLTPGTAKELHELLVENLSEKKIRFVVAPRRDWFEKNYRLCDIVRIYGADSVSTADYIEPILKITTPTLKRASHYTVSEIVKPVENAFRHLDIMLAQQLASSYNSIDIREVLELAGTKWNVNTYFPSIGIGGYCIPISSKYILEGNKTENHLSLLQEVVSFEDEYLGLLCDLFISLGLKKIGILGVSYRSDVLIMKGSHLTRIVNKLNELNIEVLLADPLFEDSDIEAFFKTKSFNINYMKQYEFDGIVVNNWHQPYDTIFTEDMLKNLFQCKILFDNIGNLEQYAKKNKLTNYRLIGRASWKSPNIDL